MKKYLALIGLGLLLCCFYADKAQASIIPDNPKCWDYFITSQDGNTWDVLNNRYNYDLPQWHGNALVVDNEYRPNKTKILAVEIQYLPIGAALLDLGVFADPSWVSDPCIVDKPGDLTIYWKIKPQPASETIVFPDGWQTYITKIEIATKCVPEPSTFIAGAIALGLLGLRKLRR